MSRIGKKPILIPDGVEVKIEEQKVIIKGPKGELTKSIRPEINVDIENQQIVVKPRTTAPVVRGKQIRAFWGLTRAHLANMVKGVTQGWQKQLGLEGVGYKAYLEGEDLVLQLGFSHPVKIGCPPGIKFSVEKNIVIVSGIDKELVGGVAARIRAVRPPEPYKGKGVKYAGEQIRRKLGKRAVSTAT